MKLKTPGTLFSLCRALSALRPRARATGLLLIAVLGAGNTLAQPRDDLMRDAREAYVRKDKARLSALRTAAVDTRHPLATWIDYWDLSIRLADARPEEVQDFYARWPGSFVEDRLRNDWLLELGKRRDWAGFAREYPRFKMDDDREVACYALLVEHQAGQDVREAANRAWLAQRDADDGCLLMARTLYQDKRFGSDDIWRKVRHATEHNRPRVARQAAGILGDEVAKAVGDVFDNPARYLATRALALGHNRSELASLAIARMAASDPALAARKLEETWGTALGGEHGAWAWAQTAKQGALALRPESLAWTRAAWDELKRRERDRPDWSDETLGWLARAALRGGQGAERWSWALRAIDAMSVAERADPTWRYWRARALQALAKTGPAGDTDREQARQALAELATEYNFYGQLAAEDLGGIQPLPARPAPPSPAEREAVRVHAGLQRALTAFSLGFRSEAVREWNFSLIGMSDRELLAAAQLACSREIWDRCINTSDRSRSEVDLEQRFPTPMRSDVLARSREIGLDPAFIYGLIRQESRFIVEARSGVGASGLMQVMPSTAQWTAKRIGMDYRPEMLAERDTNLRLGAAYLKLVLDDLSGSQPMAAAAYNAGPNRPRRWRDGPVLEPALWIENIPIHETRDYVKKVLSNSAYYAGQISGKPSALRPRLGSPIGPRDASAPAPNPDLP